MKNLKNLELTILFNVLLVVGFSQNIAKDKTHYTIKNGKFTGEYISFYDNGNIKAQGFFKENIRVGEWEIYDTLGKKKFDIDFKIGFDFILKEDNGTVIKKNEFKKWYPRNAQGMVVDRKIEQQEILFSKRIWLILNSEYNEALKDKGFELAERLIDLTEKDSIVAYSNEDDEFKNKLDKVVFDELIKGKTIVEYQLKVDYFYSDKEGRMKSRIVGLAPILLNKLTGKKELLCWYYFPFIRNFVASIMVKNDLKEIKNLDDLFCNQMLGFQVIKESNVNDKFISEIYKTTEKQLKASDNIRLHLINVEHDYWLGYLDK